MSVPHIHPDSAPTNDNHKQNSEGIMQNNAILMELVAEERRREIERYLQRQAVLDYLRENGITSPSGLRRSAHWLGVRLERMGAALQQAGGDVEPCVEVVHAH
jgi:hypothetical protein